MSYKGSKSSSIAVWYKGMDNLPKRVESQSPLQKIKKEVVRKLKIRFGVNRKLIIKKIR